MLFEHPRALHVWSLKVKILPLILTGSHDSHPMTSRGKSIEMYTFNAGTGVQLDLTVERPLDTSQAFWTAQNNLAKTPLFPGGIFDSLLKN